jgi:hypothetical protein
MPRTKQASTQKVGKRVGKNAVPVLGAAGLSLFAGGASATPGGLMAIAAGAPDITPNEQVILGEEEVSDVNLATFYVFDKETTGLPAGTVQLARGGGCGGCRGCGGGGRGCGGRGCGGRGCGGCGGGWGCGGCGCTCCLSWGSCRWC